MIDILIVDDEKKIREGISRSIDWASHGINICASAGSGTEALEMIEQFMPSIVVTDISMEEMDGLELLEIISQTYPYIKVILISGFKDFEYAQKAVTLNAFCYITKPISPELLVQKIIEAKSEIDQKMSEVKVNDNIRRKLRENLLVLKDSFLRMLMEGKIRDKGDIMGRAHLMEIDLDYKQFLVCIMEFDTSASFKSTNIYDMSFYKAAIMSSAEERIREICECHVFNLDNRIGIIVCSEEIEKSIIRMKLEDTKIWVNENMGLTLAVGIGSISGNIERITLSYRGAMDALQYRMILGKNVIVDTDEITDMTKEKIAMDDFDSILQNNEEDMLIALKNGNIKGVVLLVDQMMENVRQIVRNDIQQKERVVFLLAFFLIKILYNLDIHDQKYYGKENDLFMSLNAMTSIEDIRKSILEFFEDTLAIMEKKMKSKNGFLVNNALKSIRDNIYEDVSLVSVAEKLQIHPNYLSKIFKAETGQSFTEHVIKYKMNEAKKLLKDSQLKIYEIADRLSYKDVAHFTRLFKKYFGVSPSEYRQLL
ncbi:MAG: response regulator [Clostridia bacterium]